MGVQQMAHVRQAPVGHRQLQRQQLAFHLAVRQHHHGDEAALVHGDQLKAPHGGGGFVVRHGVSRIAHKGRDHLARPGHDLVRSRQLLGQRGVELFLLLPAQGPALHQLVDIQPVALGGGDPSGGGVGLFQIAHLRQVRQLVADGGGTDLAGHSLGDGLGAHRLRRRHIFLHHDLQYLFFSIGQFHIVFSVSTPTS